MIESPTASPRRSIRRSPAHCLPLMLLALMLLALMLLAAGLMPFASLAATAQTPDTTKRILVLPALQWTDTASTWQYTELPDPSQIATLLGGLQFGMSPEQVGQHLPDRSNALHWDDLPEAKEFTPDVRYVWLPAQAADTLLGSVKSCVGSSSYVVLLFFNKALFRVSWRFLPDQRCANPREAAEDVYAAIVPLAPTVVVSARYTAGYAEVVDVTDPNAGALLPVRWQMQGQ